MLSADIVHSDEMTHGLPMDYLQVANGGEHNKKSFLFSNHRILGLGRVHLKIYKTDSIVKAESTQDVAVARALSIEETPYRHL